MRLVGYALLLVAAAALLGWAGLADRWLHPARGAVTGTAQLSLDAYADAAARMLRPGSQIVGLSLPEGEGPVAVEAMPQATVYLDPPTARVLEVAAGDAAPTPARHAPLAALPLAQVVARAEPLAHGAALRRIEWPGAGAPDWTVRFAGADGPVAIKVADDVGTALVARDGSLPLLAEARAPWLLVAVAAGVVGLAMVALGGRRKPATPKRRRKVVK